MLLNLIEFRFDYQTISMVFFSHYQKKNSTLAYWWKKLAGYNKIFMNVVQFLRFIKQNKEKDKEEKLDTIRVNLFSTSTPNR